MIKYLESRGHNTYWLCQCECGEIREVRKSHLKSGGTRSCGCLCTEKSVEQNKAWIGTGNYFSSRGHPLSTLYYRLNHMRQRCYNPNNPSYSSYGGKGIKVCDEWKNDFTAFKNWALVNGYEKGLVLHRLDPDDDYRPGNCKFVSRSENSKRVWPDRLERIELEGENKRLRKENKKLRGWGWRLAQGVL